MSSDSVLFVLLCAVIPLVLATPVCAAGQSHFDLDSRGYVHNWLVAGPATEEKEADLPDSIAINATGPGGKPWRYASSGDDTFIYFGDRLGESGSVSVYTAVDIEALQDTEVNARVRIDGRASLWLNGDSLGAHGCGTAVKRIHLNKGRNQFVALLKASGQSGYHMGIGLQLPGQTGRVKVLMPGPAEVTADLVRAETWLREATATEFRTAALRRWPLRRLVAKTPPPFPARANLYRMSIDWPANQAHCDLPDGDDIRNLNQTLAIIDCRKNLLIAVEIEVRNQLLLRRMEFAPDIPLALPDKTPSLDAHRAQHLAKLFDQRPCTLTAYYGTYFVQGLIRKMRGEQPVDDAARFKAAMRRIDERIDCADFDLAFALRFYRLGAGTEDDRRKIRESALGFRYWHDEPGNDGMVFRTENHSLLFHSDQLIAGNLWQDEIFTNSGATGREQAVKGRQRCIEWLDKVEATGYEEFLSTTYAPITIGALMNLVDFADDPELSERASRQVDKIYRMMAEHTFDGLTMGAQERTSRRMLYPQVLTTQALMAHASPLAVEAFDPWTIFPASSPHYRLPADLDKLMALPVRKEYRESEYLINLGKTSEYLLSSIEIPASAKDPSLTGRVTPGSRGYQHHIWHAILARDCQVFTTHPGSTSDSGIPLPGFWTGNSIFPRQTRDGNMVLQIFVIPEDHPVQFTHAYWPSDAFDAQQVRGNWIFGRKGKGYIALWCSTKPVMRSEALPRRELRAWGNKAAWVAICSGESESGDFQSFIRSCESLRPQFDPENLTLSVQGYEPMRWDDRS